MQTESLSFPKLLSKQQTANLLGVSEQTVANLIKREELSCIKVGKFLKFKEDDVMNYLSGKSKNSY